MQFESEFLVFEPTPKGYAKYDQFTNGFYLYGPPAETVMSQGSGSGGSISQLTFAVKATRQHFALIGDLAANNSKKTTKITHTSVEKVDGKLKEMARNIYEEITFMHTGGQHTGGNQLEQLLVVVNFVKKDCSTGDWDESGRASPTYKSKVDLRKGTVVGG